MTLLPFGSWRPDLAETNPGVSKVMRNVMLTKDANGVSIGPHPSLVALSTATALPETAFGNLSTVDRTGSFSVLVGTSSKIYKASSSFVFSAAGTGYTLPNGEWWSTVQFGEKALFTNSFDGLQAYDIEAGGSFASVANTFKPRAIAIIFDCLFGFDCTDSVGDRDNRLIRNSDFNDYTNFKTGVAGYQPLPDGEALMGGGELSAGYGLALQRNAIRLLTRTSDRSVYTINKMADGVGPSNTQGIVFARGAAYFAGTGGFFRVSAQGVESIGKDRVNKWFFDRASAGALQDIQGAYDPRNDRIVWRWPSDLGGDDSIGNTVANVFNAELIYDIRADEWVEGSFATAGIFTSASPGYTLEELDQFGPLDSLPYSLDDRFWFGDDPQLAGLTTDKKMGFFSGTPLEAVAETTTTAFPNSVLITSSKPITDDAGALVSIGVSDALNQAVVYKGSQAIQPSGRAPGRARGKNASFEITHPEGGTWTYDRGIDDIDAKAGGPR